MSPGQASAAVRSVSTPCIPRGPPRGRPWTTAGAQPSLRSQAWVSRRIHPHSSGSGFPSPFLLHSLLGPLAHPPATTQASGAGQQEQRDRECRGSSHLWAHSSSPQKGHFLRALSTCQPPPLPPPAHAAGLPGGQRVHDSSPGGASPPQGSKGSWAPSALAPPPGSRPRSALFACKVPSVMSD